MNILKSFFIFLEEQVLSMKWLNSIIGNILYKLIENESLRGALQFFIYDTIKIFILLCILIFAISYIQSFFPPERARDILTKYDGITANILSALLGTVTPFCSCSSIPLFLGFTSAGIPISMTFSFLISSPLVDLASLILLSSIFGFKIAIYYVLVGIILAVLGGTIIGKLKLERYLEDYVQNIKVNNCSTIEDSLTIKDRIIYAKRQVLETIKKIYLYIIIGVAIGAFIHNIIPSNFIESILGKNNWYSVIIASIIGIPLYADIFGIIPIAESLYYKGAGLGTVLSFMMSVTALSLPSIIMLKKVMKNRLLFIFVMIVTIGIIIIGYLFNIFYFLFI